MKNVIFLTILLLAAGGIYGCGDNNPTSVQGDLPSIDGAYVPETAEEGVPVTIEVWGSTADETWTLSGFSIGNPSGSMLTVTPNGRGSRGMGHGGMGGGGMDPGGRRGMFRGTASLPGLPAGDHMIRIIGANGPMDFPIHVFPRNAMIRMNVGVAGEMGRAELVITWDGFAIAHASGEGMPVRVPIPPEEIERIRGLFRDANFMALEDRYIEHDPPQGRIFMIMFRPDRETVKRVVAEASAAPPELLALQAALQRLLDRIVQENPARPPVVGSLDLDPPVGPAGTPRTIQLILRNRTADTLTVHFPTEQMYDVLILSPMEMGQDSLGMGGIGDMGGMGGMGGDGGMGGHMGGGGMGGMGGAPGDPPRPLLLWNWAYGRTFGPDPVDLVFLPEEIRTFDVTWPGTANDGTVVPAGAYIVMAPVLGRPPVPVRPAEVLVTEAPPGP